MKRTVVPTGRERDNLAVLASNIDIQRPAAAQVGIFAACRTRAACSRSGANTQSKKKMTVRSRYSRGCQCGDHRHPGPGRP